MSQPAMQRGGSAKSSPIDLSGTFLRRTNLSGANLSWANLSRADFTNADFRGANLEGTDLTDTVLHGADLTDVRNLTAEQIERAQVDGHTKLPQEFRSLAPAR